MKKIAFVVYPLELLATILFILTVAGIITNYDTIFYVIWVMGLLMSAFAGARDAVEDKKLEEVFPPIIMYSLIGLGIFQVILLIAMFFPQNSDFLLALIILFTSIVVKWCVVHGYKLYSSFSEG